MKLNIPTVGTRLRLLEDWEFTIQNERRNRRFWESYFGKPCPSDYVYSGGAKIWLQASLPKGTILKVDRIYIRQGMPLFDSITFNLTNTATTFNTKGRFWVKLADANKIEAEVVEVEA
jgi:hypothetical protein